MKVGVCSYAYRWSLGSADYQPTTPLSFAGLVERAATHGAQVVQFADNKPLHFASQAELDDLKQAATAHSIEVELGTGSTDLTLLQQYLELAERFDAHLLRVSPNSDDLQQSRDDLLRNLEQAGDLMAEAGCVLALENHYLLSARDLASLVSTLEHPAVGVCLDVANSVANGEWTEDIVTYLAPHAVNLHLKDYHFIVNPGGVGFCAVGTPIGEGRVDVAHVLKGLHDAERDVNVLVEHWLPLQWILDGSLALEDDWTQQGVETVKTHLAQI